MPLSYPRALEHALADLIERRETKILLPADRTSLDRMIDDLEAEICLRRRENANRPAEVSAGSR